MILNKVGAEMRTRLNIKKQNYGGPSGENSGFLVVYYQHFNGG
jgi:hypothetical protein